jgi:sterol desaturase/sphingolipid hydroxylase (fatty acid hydroxylase superfamily)
MDFISNALAVTWTELRFVAVVYCIGLALESLLPAEAEQPLGNIGFNLIYTAIFLSLTNLLVPPLQTLVKPLVATFGLAWPIAFPDHFAGQLLQGLAFLFIYDFFYYWFHRAQHELPFLWAQHKLHHSDVSLNITTGNRHHWLEEPMRVFVVLLPIALLFDQKPVTIGWLWTTLLLWGYFIHLNLRLELGPLTPVFCGPQVHRIHHSNKPEDFDRNYAAFFPIFDIVFGSYKAPRRGEFPTTGLGDGENLNGLVRSSLAPFRSWFGIDRRHAAPTKTP